MFRDSTKDAKDEQAKFNDELQKTNDLIGAKQYQAFLRDIGAITDEFVELADGSGVLVPTFNDNINILDKFAERLKKAKEVELTNYKTFFVKSMIDLQRSIDNLDADDLLFVTQTQKIKEYKQALKLVEIELNKYSKIKQKINKESLKNVKDNEIKETEIVKTELQKRFDAVKTYYDLLKLIYRDDFERLKELEQQKTDEIAKNYEKVLTLKIKETGFNEIVENQKQEKTKETFDKIATGLTITQNIQNTTSQIARANYDKEARALDDKLKRGAISQQQYDRKIEKLNKEFAKKEKRNAELSIIINTALAVSKYLAKTGDLTMIGASAIIAEGAAQLAIVEATQYKKGALINEFGEIKGKRHSQGGEPLANHIDKSNVENGELISIFNRETSMKNFDKIQSFTQAANNDNLDLWHFNKGFDVNNYMYQNANIEIERLIKSQQYTNQRLLNIEKLMSEQFYILPDGRAMNRIGEKFDI